MDIWICLKNKVTILRLVLRRRDKIEDEVKAMLTVFFNCQGAVPFIRFQAFERCCTSQTIKTVRWLRAQSWICHIVKTDLRWSRNLNIMWRGVKGHLFVGLLGIHGGLDQMLTHVCVACDNFNNFTSKTSIL